MGFPENCCKLSLQGGIDGRGGFSGERVGFCEEEGREGGGKEWLVE